jgi:hypothetical protein
LGGGINCFVARSIRHCSCHTSIRHCSCHTSIRRCFVARTGSGSWQWLGWRLKIRCYRRSSEKWGGSSDSLVARSSRWQRLGWRRRHRGCENLTRSKRALKDNHHRLRRLDHPRNSFHGKVADVDTVDCRNLGTYRNGPRGFGLPARIKRLDCRSPLRRWKLHEMEPQRRSAGSRKSDCDGRGPRHIVSRSGE